MSRLKEENENAIWMIYYSFYLWVKKCSYILKIKKHFCSYILMWIMEQIHLHTAVVSYLELQSLSLHDCY